MQNRNMNKTILCLLILPFFISCTPETRKELARPEPIRPVPKMPLSKPLSIPALDEKIDFLLELLNANLLDDDQKEAAETYLSGLQEIKKLSQEDLSIDDYHKIIAMLFQQLYIFEKKYFRSQEVVEDTGDKKMVSLLTSKKEEILDDYISGEHQSVINKCMELEALFGPEALTTDIGLLFALSLAEKGMIQEALNIGERIIPGLEGKPDLIHLRAAITEWLLEMDNRKQAGIYFEKLIDSFDDRVAIFNRVKRKMSDDEPKVVDFKATDPSKKPSPIEADIQKKPETIEDLLREVDQLVKSDAFAAAKLLLIKWRGRIEEGPDVETIDQALKTVELAEERYGQRLQQEKESLNNAKKLIEKEDFEEAIEKLDELKDSPEIGPETERLKNLAIEKFIRQERDRAAKLYLMAKKTNTPEQKEELLKASHHILKTLIKKYPSSSLIEKLKSNLKSVKKDLEKYIVQEGDGY